MDTHYKRNKTLREVWEKEIQIIKKIHQKNECKPQNCIFIEPMSLSFILFSSINTGCIKSNCLIVNVPHFYLFYSCFSFIFIQQVKVEKKEDKEA